MATEVFLILHGWGGNKPAHWQEHLVTKLKAAGKRCYYPLMPDPGAPNLEAWQSRLKEELAKISSEVPDAAITVLTHSLGSVNWLHLVNSRGASAAKLAEKVLLIAPPYIVPQVLPIDVPEAVAPFFPPPCNAAAVKAAATLTVMIASDTDDYSTYDQSCGYARDLGIEIFKLPGAGHISPYYGYGEWHWIEAFCLGTAELPPVARS